jgi:hypothetical protein
MWQSTLQTIFDFFREAKSSSEDRAEFAQMVNKLRHQPVQDKELILQPTHTTQHSGTGAKEATLFDSFSAVGRSVKRERKSVGYWFQMSEKAERENKLLYRQRSYEVDFHPGLGVDDMNLQVFLSGTAQQKAIESYIRNSQPAIEESSNRLIEEEAASYIPEEFPAVNDPPITKTEELLLRLAQSAEDSIRASVASNEHAPIAAMWLLSEDDSTEVKLGLVANPKSPVAILERLTADFDGKVARKAQSRLRRMYQQEVGIAAGNLSSAEDADDEAIQNSFNQSIAM